MTSVLVALPAGGGAGVLDSGSAVPSRAEAASNRDVAAPNAGASAAARAKAASKAVTRAVGVAAASTQA